MGEKYTVYMGLWLGLQEIFTKYGISLYSVRGLQCLQHISACYHTRPSTNITKTN